MVTKIGDLSPVACRWCGVGLAEGAGGWDHPAGVLCPGPPPAAGPDGTAAERLDWEYAAGLIKLEGAMTLGMKVSLAAHLLRDLFPGMKLGDPIMDEWDGAAIGHAVDYLVAVDPVTVSRVKLDDYRRDR